MYYRSNLFFVQIKYRKSFFGQLTRAGRSPLFGLMEQIFLCACCGEENEVFIDQIEGRDQQLVFDCSICCNPNVIIARFNDYTNEYDLEVYLEDVG
jgi:hypothetical protein